VAPHVAQPEFFGLLTALLLLDFLYVIINDRSMEIQFTTQIFKEGRTYVAYTPQLDVSSCGGTADKALRNLKEAVRLFLEETEKLGTVRQILGKLATWRGTTEGKVQSREHPASLSVRSTRGCQSSLELE
jgi:predicted RNase H-like HicB family nuclease